MIKDAEKDKETDKEGSNLKEYAIYNLQNEKNNNSTDKVRNLSELDTRHRVEKTVTFRVKFNNICFPK